MADQITVPTFEQIETILSKLATNYSNLAILFYDIFYNTEPMDVTFQMFNEAGELETYVIPNRAKDKANILSGNGSPEGQVEAGEGVLYQDLENGELYIKLLPEGSMGWTSFITHDEMQNMLVEGIGDPEGAVFADRGTLYVDKANANLYVKAEDDSNIGWILISADTRNLASRDLDNLTLTGEAHFANPSLSNLSAAGQAVLDAKEDIANKVTTISEDSTDTEYPTAKAVYDWVGEETSVYADRDFDNITATAESKFIGTNKSLDGVLDAPSLMHRGPDNSFILPYGTTLLCANGVTEGHVLNNKVVKTVQNIAGVVPTLPNENGFIFYDDTYGIIRTPRAEVFFYQVEEPPVVTGGVWYEPQDCNYYVTGISSDMDVWIQVPMVRLGRWSTDEEGEVKTFEPYYPLRVVNSESKELDHTVVEIGGTETNWYRLYKDGWIEAGGCGTGNTDIAFHKNFKTTNYTFVPAGATSYTKAVDGVSITAVGDFDWMAKGWAE